MSVVLAKVLRQNLTDAEHALWYRIRAQRLAGLKFKRQEPMGRYIVDFVCHESKLIIELDGGQHADQLVADNLRTRFLESRAYRVLRFWNDEVLKNMEGVLEVVLANVSTRGKSHKYVPLPPGGGGDRGEGALNRSDSVSRHSPSPQPLSRRGRGAKSSRGTLPSVPLPPRGGGDRGEGALKRSDSASRHSPSTQPISRQGRLAKNERAR